MHAQATRTRMLYKELKMNEWKFQNDQEYVNSIKMEMKIEKTKMIAENLAACYCLWLRFKFN